MKRVSIFLICFFAFSVFIMLLISCAERQSYESNRLLYYYSNNTCAGDSIYNPGETNAVLFDSALVEVTIDGLEVTLNHKNAFLNCCLDSITVKLNQSGDTVKFLEEECVTSPCDCICPFEVIAVVQVTNPGIYIFEIWTQEFMVWRKSIEVGGNSAMQ